MTDATVASTVAPSLLRLVLRRVVAFGAATAVVGGGARLAHDEVRLAGVSSDAQALLARAEQSGAHARRAARLELDLAHLQEEARALAAARGEGERRVRDLEASVAATREAVSAAERDRDAARADLGQTTGLIQAREAALGELNARLETELRALAEARGAATRAAERAEQLEGELASSRVALEAARTREAALAADLDVERRRAAERDQALSGLRERLRAAEVALADAETRARRDAERLDRLGRAGVNWPRVTGERPMPDVNALVVNVDADSVPPVVVVHAGQPEGLERGDALVVVRDGQELARLEVDEVRGPYSTARVVRAGRGIRIRPGDQVRSAPR